LKDVVEIYWESGENLGIDACFEIISIEKPASGKKMEIPVCQICSQMILQYPLDYLRDNLEVTVKAKDPEVKITL
jgi:hypothetical protein